MAEKSLFALFFTIFYLLRIKQANSQGDNVVSNVIDITKYGAMPNGDATEALAAAWRDACGSTTPSKVLIPQGSYTMRAVEMKGPCKATNIEVEILGNFKAPPEPIEFTGFDTWVKFEKVNGLTLTSPQGSGIFDGQGALAWKQYDCAQTGNCGGQLPFNFRFNFLTNSVIRGITSLNSKLFHMKLSGCRNVTLDQVTVTAPRDSFNTDGIVIVRSHDVNITGTTIATGDDCMSIGDGTKNLLVENVTCGPGLGISVGSFGKYPNEEPVLGVTIRGCTIKDADNGVRVKTWKNSYETHVSGLHFEDITIENVWYPVIIDQEYCPYQACTGKTPSKVKLSDIRFQNIRGTSRKKEAVKLVCSQNTPCDRVELIDIDLTYNGSDGPAVSVCKNVNPITSGKQNPPACTQDASAPSSMDTESIETTDL